MRANVWVAVATSLLGCLASACDQSANVEVTGTWIPDESFVESMRPQFRVEDATITFDEDGKWTGNDGCNDLGGPYDVDGDGWSAGLDPVAGVGCPYGEVPYERVIVREAERVSRSDDALTFYGDDDTTLLVLSLSAD